MTVISPWLALFVEQQSFDRYGDVPEDIKKILEALDNYADDRSNMRNLDASSDALTKAVQYLLWGTYL